MMEASEDTARRDFLYYATAGAGVVATGAALWPLVNQMNPSADVRALAQITVDISDLAPGTQLTVNWRGKPVFIRHRTEAEMAQARAEAASDLPDSQARNPNLPDDALASDENRAIAGHEAYLVMIGVCTHLGCVPLGDGAGDFGGWFCPCHGSCRVALKSVLPQFVWRNYPELGTFGRDSRDFKKALVARERRFGSRR